MAESKTKSGPIGLVVAMDAELIHTLRRYPPSGESCRGPWTFHHLYVGDSEVVALR